MKKVYCGITCLALSAAMVMSSVPVNVLAMVDEDIILSTDEGALVIQEDTETISDNSSNDVDGIISDDTDSTSLLESTGREAEINDAEALNVSEDRELTDNSNVLTDSDVVNNSTDELKDETVDMVEEDAPNMLGTSDVVTTDWYKYYVYDLDNVNRKLILKCSNGELYTNVGPSITIPAQTRINGVDYTTVLDNTGRKKSIWDNDRSIRELIIEEGVKTADDSSYLFRNLYNLTTLDVSGLDTTNVTDMSYMFSGCSSLTTLDVSNFNTSRVTNMSRLFGGCYKIKSLDLSNFNTSSVTDMSNMFLDMGKMEEVNVSSFDTSHVTDMRYMFSGCNSLASLDVKNFRTHRVTDYMRMFYSMKSLKTLDIRSFTFIEGCNVYNMFSYCNMIYLYLPDSGVRNYNFSGTSAYPDLLFIYFVGTESEWKALDNTVRDQTTVKYNCDPAEGTIKAFVIRMYKVVLGRDPDQRGLEDWNSQLRSGKKTGAEVVANFYLSDELQNKQLSDSAFVDLAYKGMMNRNSDAGGKSYWMDALKSGVSRRYVVCGFIESKEFETLCGDYGIVKGTYDVTEYRDKNLGITKFCGRLYTKALMRNYDISGLNYWCKKIVLDKSRANVIRVATDGFFNSTEFKNRNFKDDQFIRICYNTFLDRNAEANGLNYWKNKLKSGMTRDQVIEGFARSTEFDNIMKKYGL